MNLRKAFASGVLAATLVVTAAGTAFAEDPSPTPEPTPTPAPTVVFPLKVGSTGIAVQTLQTRLTWLGYKLADAETSTQTFDESTRHAVKLMQAKYYRVETGEVSDKFNAFIAKIAAPLHKLPKACRKGVVICIDKKQKLLRWVKNGHVKITTDARFGIPGETTANGRHQIERKEKHNVSEEYNTPMPFSMFFFGNQAIHFSYWFRRDGYYGGSHGCVNIRSWADMKWVYAHSPIGTRVFIYSS